MSWPTSNVSPKVRPTAFFKSLLGQVTGGPASIVAPLGVSTQRTFSERDVRQNDFWDSLRRFCRLKSVWILFGYKTTSRPFLLWVNFWRFPSPSRLVIFHVSHPIFSRNCPTQCIVRKIETACISQCFSI